MNLSFSMSQVAAAAKYRQLPDVKTAGTVHSSGTPAPQDMVDTLAQGFQETGVHRHEAQLLAQVLVGSSRFGQVDLSAPLRDERAARLAQQPPAAG
jgi:hypothetical protein